MCTGLNPRGNAIISERGFKVRMREALAFVLGSARQKLETGKILRLSASKKVSTAVGLAASAMARHFHGFSGGSFSRR